MPPSPETRASLVLRLRNAHDEAAWAEFVALYEPVILRLLRKHGLQDCDARDVCQQVVSAVARDVVKWQPDGRSASFRRWLFGIARNRVLKFFYNERRAILAQGGSAALFALDAQPDHREGELSAELEREYRQQRLLWAADAVRGEFHDTTWQAFWQTCIEDRSIPDVARDLNISRGTVYVARSRIIARLRQKILDIEGASEN